MNRHIVIEPHADDAFLSLGGHIEMWRKRGEPVLIVTVYSGTRKRARDAQAYAEAVGASWLGLGAEEPDPRGRKAAEAVEAWRYDPPPLEDSLSVYVPLAFANPEHLAVRSVVEDRLEHLRRPPPLYFLDQPYAGVQANGDALQAALFDTTVVSYLRPPARKYRHIPLFKDQAKFWHFNPAEKLQHNIELIVKEA